MDNRHRIDRLERATDLDAGELKTLLSTWTEEDRAYAAGRARRVALANFGRHIFFRGLIEVSNYCRNDCLYCGIRRSNANATRYRLTDKEILACCAWSHDAGFRTFVLQGGEDGAFSVDRLCTLLTAIRRRWPDTAITLSLGEMKRDDYRRLKEAGADRYLLRHETATAKHYARLHPPELSLTHRQNCLRDLKDLGFQTGAGFMVGSPWQTTDHIVADLLFLKGLEPQMVGIGPFIPHHDTPLRDFPAGSLELTLFLLSLIRLMHPRVLLPSTTALGTIAPDGREQGILAGANVIMPNVSPLAARVKYLLYDHKIGTTDSDESENQRLLTAKIEALGYERVVGRGDYAPNEVRP